MVVAADLTTNSLEVHANPIPKNVIYKPTKYGEPTGLTLHDGLIYLVTPPFPVSDEDHQPLFLNWRMNRGNKRMYQQIFEKALKEYGVLYALVARVGYFNDDDREIIDRFLDY